MNQETMTDFSLEELKEELLLIQVGRDAHAPQPAHGNRLHPNGGPDARDAGVETSIGVEPPTLLAAWLHPRTYVILNINN